MLIRYPAAAVPMHSSLLQLDAATHVVVEDIRRLVARIERPVLVAIDGGSGSGKSTLAVSVASAVDGTVVPGDDFFAAHLTDAEWDARGPAERAADAIDWKRLRRTALEPLLSGHPARWHPFDFVAGRRTDGTYRLRAQEETRQPKRVIILDGAYASRLELSDLIDWSVLVDVPIGIRHARLAQREEADFLAAWHSRWDSAEAWYLETVRPKSSFDRVVENGCDSFGDGHSATG